MRTTSTAVVRALDDEDVEGLLAVGAPGDEYEVEGRLIAEALERLPDTDFVVERVMVIVVDARSRMFGPFNEDEMRMCSLCLPSSSRTDCGRHVAE